MDHFQLLPIAWNLLHSVSTPVMLKVYFKYLFLLESPGQPGLAQTSCKHAGTACPQHPLINCSSLQPFCTGQSMNCSREKDFPNIYGNLATQRPCPVTFCPPGPHSCCLWSFGGLSIRYFTVEPSWNSQGARSASLPVEKAGTPARLRAA